MYRSIQITTLGLAAILTLNAGQIQLGGTNGLTASYVSPTFNATTNPVPANSTSCAGVTNATSTGQTGFNNCMTPNGTTYVKSTYQAALFANATPAATVPASPLTGGGASFARIAETLPIPVANDWITNAPTKATVGSVTTPSDIVVAVGVYGVDKIWTMLNDYWGANGVVNTQVLFTFDDSSNGLGGVSGPTVETVALTNGQQIRSAVQTTANTTGGAAIATTLTTGPVTIGNAQVTAGNIFSSAYTGGVTGQYLGTTGTIGLDYQLFDFGSLHTNEFLVSITIRSQLAGTQVGSSSGQTRAALSAITISQVPEPSTIFLSLAGLGALGYYRRRRKA